MLDCLILGDSIAVGVHVLMPQCAIYAKVGITSRDWNLKWAKAELESKTAIISLGSNDHVHIKTAFELSALRSRLKADKVFWIMPAGNAKTSGVSLSKLQEIVTETATAYGDTIVTIRHVSPDGVHPTVAGYRKLKEDMQ